MNRLLRNMKDLLSESGFTIENESSPDEESFGNWILIATRETLAIRIACDRNDLMVDLMPSHSLRERASEDDWYAWDIVVEALHLRKISSAEEMVRYLLPSNGVLEAKFDPTTWEKFTLHHVREAETKKRHRFMEGHGLQVRYKARGGEGKMANESQIYVERRDDGRYAVRRGNAERASAIVDTQKEAIERARELNPGHSPHVERVRNTDKGSPDKWRKP